MNLDGVDPGLGGYAGGFDVFRDDPLDLGMAEDVDAAVVEVAGEGRRRRTRHAALLDELDAEVGALGMDPVGEYAHAFMELRVPEDAGLLAQGTHTGWLEARDVHMLHMPRRAADPGEAVIDAGHPVVDEVIEPRVVGGERTCAAAVGRDEEPVRQMHRAHGDGLEGMLQGACWAH